MPHLILPRTPGENAIIAALPAEERAKLEPLLERKEVVLRQVLMGMDEPLSHVWFVRRGVISMVTEMDDGGIIELATIGWEGLVGVPTVLGADRMAHKLFCQIPGEADRLPVATFIRLLEELPTLRKLAMRYALTLFTQIAQGAGCSRLHPIEARCARWLLMTHDRMDEDTYLLTQEFLGQMLGVTRPSVSIAAGMLQKAGYISYVRGKVTIHDRPGLERAACECYGVITREFNRLVENEPPS